MEKSPKRWRHILAAASAGLALLGPVYAADAARPDCALAPGAALAAVDTALPPWVAGHPQVLRQARELLDGYAEQVRREARALFEEFPDTCLLPYRLDVTRMQRFANRDGAVGIRLGFRLYTGGAHGQHAWYAWNLQPDGAPLSLQESLGGEPLAMMLHRLRAALLQALEADSRTDEQQRLWIQQATQASKLFSAWSFGAPIWNRVEQGGRAGLLFTFPPYQVASFAGGAVEVFVPLAPVP